MLIVLLFVLLIVLLFGGGVGYSRYGWYSWSPFALAIVIVLVLFLAGILR